MLAAQTAQQQGEKSAHVLLNIVSDIIESSELDVEIDYLELLDQDDLQPVETLSSPALIATAVFYGPVRLIDNIELA